MGIGSGVGKLIAAPLLLFNLACAIIILGLAGRVLDKGISGVAPGTGSLGGFQGNGATPYVVLFSLIAAMTAIAAYITGLHHLLRWRSSSGAAAQATAWIAQLLLILAFCLAWKEIHQGGSRGTKLKVLESFIIILTITHLIYTLSLYLGGKHHDDNTSTKTRNHNKPLNPNAHDGNVV